MDALVENYLVSLNTATTPLSDTTKLPILVNYLAPSIYDFNSERQTYTDAVKLLQDIHIKPESEVFNRHLLQNRKERAGESHDNYLNYLKILARDCSMGD